MKDNGLSNNQISKSLGKSRTTIIKYLGLIESSGICLKELLELKREELSELFEVPNALDPFDREQIHKDLYSIFPYVDKELKRVGVHPSDSLDRVQNKTSGRGHVQSILRTLQQMEPKIRGLYAHCPRSGGKAVHRLCGQKTPHHRQGNGRNKAGGSLCCHSWRKPIHLCRSFFFAEDSRFYWQCPKLSALSGRCSSLHYSRQSKISSNQIQ